MHTCAVWLIAESGQHAANALGAQNISESGAIGPEVRPWPGAALIR